MSLALRFVNGSSICVYIHMHIVRFPVECLLIPYPIGCTMSDQSFHKSNSQYQMLDIQYHVLDISSLICMTDTCFGDKSTFELRAGLFLHM